MTRLSVEVTEEQGNFISDLIADGNFADADSVMRVALTRFQAAEDTKLVDLRAAIQEGFDSPILDGDPFEVVAKRMNWEYDF